MHVASAIITLCAVVGSTIRVAAFVPSPFINSNSNSNRQLHRSHVGPRAAAEVDASFDELADAALEDSDGESSGSSAHALEENIKFLAITVPDDAPSRRLRLVFEDSMVSADVPLLSSWGSYWESLPSRYLLGIGKYIKLCDVPFYATDDSIDVLTKQLEDIILPIRGIPRFAVAYLSARTRSGKTSSILPVFLNSYTSNRMRRFTHYLYMAFNNNAANNFSATGKASRVSDIAEQQGALFIYKCVAKLLEGEYTDITLETIEAYRKDVLGRNRGISILRFATNMINLLLQTKIPGEDQRFLIHLDEHRKMNTNPNFRRGAMTALAMCNRVKCVATFTEPLTELLPMDESSGACRQPCTHLTFDLPEYLEKRESIDIRRLVARQDQELPSIQARKWATLVFRMASMVQVYLPLTLYLKDTNGTIVAPSEMHDKNVNRTIVAPLQWLEDIQTALVEFSETTAEMETLDENNGGIAAVDTALRKCFNATALKPCADIEHGKFALDLMNGISEAKFRTRRFGDNSVACGLTILNGKVVASWQDLLTLEYDDLVAFGDASQSFRDSLTEPDYLSGIPLEEAYGWSLLSRSAARGRLRFGVGFSFLIKANDYKTGRLFRTDTAELDQMVHPAQLKNGVLYRAAEGGNGVDHLKTSSTLNGVQAYKDAKAVAAAQKTTDEKKKEPRPNHPLCDFFFKSNDNELVMIDIAGGNDAEKKGKKLDDWIDEYGGRVTTAGILRIVGIVLAPFDKVAAVTEISGETSAIQPGIELPAGDSSDEEEEKREVVGLEEGDDERPPASEDGDEKSTHETPGDRNAGSGSATIYRKGKTDQVLLVRGRKAIDLLGALGQIAEWFNVSLGRPIDLAAEPPAGNDGEDQATQPAGPSGA
mmetsp:Transcript_12098/g.35058  ORF Transcript_12098/g.35058 Transcript_12098/m.35058 type:complete len:881 (+) Transcript_12098:116-2758(+)